MKVVIQLFARARDLAGVPSVALELPEGATVAVLRACLARDWPTLEPLLRRSVIAVNAEFAEDSQVLSEGAEGALLPPVSGGAGPRLCAAPESLIMDL